MQIAKVMGTETSISGLCIRSAVPRKSGPYRDITFSNGMVMQGSEPFSLLPLYSFTVTSQKMQYDKPLILDMIPSRLPLSINRLEALMNACGVEYDLENMINDGIVDLSPSPSEDQTPKIIEHYPDLVELLETHYEGVLYLRFDDAILLEKVYGMGVIRELSPAVLKKTAHMARHTPALLAFRVTIPSKVLPEINEEKFDILTQISGHDFTIGERSAIVLYHKWLKKDIYEYGHTFSTMATLARSSEFPFKERGLAFLLENKIISVENNSDVFLMEVLKWEDSIRIACDVLQERAENATIPLRSPTDVYNKAHLLVDLDKEQSEGLELVEKNPVSVLSGKAGTGKTTILAHLVNKYQSGAVIGCGPTNRAVRELTKRVTGSNTMHRLVYDLVSGDFPKPENVRIILCDEASMMALRLTATLLEVLIAKLPNLCKLVLVGDIAQLESVEAGSVLTDFARYFPAVFLTTCHRVDPESLLIHENATKIREQNPALVTDDKCFVIVPPTGNVYNDIENALKTDGIHPWNTHIISPYREQARDINGIAKQVYSKNISNNGIYVVGDKIMCIKNHHSAGLINGDFFAIKRIDVMGMVEDLPTIVVPSIASTSYKLGKDEWLNLTVVYAPSTDEEFKIMDTQTPFKISLKDVPLSSFTLGYCTTNHKFQGCEADNVIFYMPKHTRFVNWKHIYTGVTRARKRVIIIAHQTDLKQAIVSRIFPRRSKLHMHLSRRNAHLDCLEPEVETPEERFNYLKREMTVEDTGETDENNSNFPGKRGRSDYGPNNEKQFRRRF